MGRHRKYNTEEEQKIASQEKSMRYYWKNCKRVKQKNLRRYYENKRNLQNHQ